MSVEMVQVEALGEVVVLLLVLAVLEVAELLDKVMLAVAQLVEQPLQIKKVVLVAVAQVQ
jgi:hypothetical protein